MEIKFFKAADVERNLKCTVHKSGKLGFTDAAIKKLDVEVNRFIKIGTTEGSSDLFMSVQKVADEYCFKASKAGAYYYINTKPFFDFLDIDYVNHSIIYDMIEILHEDQTIYKLKRRDKNRVERKK